MSKCWKGPWLTEGNPNQVSLTSQLAKRIGEHGSHRIKSGRGLPRAFLGDPGLKRRKGNKLPFPRTKHLWELEAWPVPGSNPPGAITGEEKQPKKRSFEWPGFLKRGWDLVRPAPSQTRYSSSVCSWRSLAEIPGPLALGARLKVANRFPSRKTGQIQSNKNGCLRLG